MLENTSLSVYGIVYKVTNLLDSRVYIGQTIRLKTFKHYFGSGLRILRAIKLHGRKSFSKEILHYAYSKDELDLLERQAIETHNSYHPVGYNLKEGGSYGSHGLETRQKISRSNKGKTKGRSHRPEDIAKRAASQKGRISPNKGVSMTEAQKVKISIALKGKVRSEEHRSNISKAAKGKSIYKEVATGIRKTLYTTDLRITSGEFVHINKGRSISLEQRLKQSQTTKGRKLPPRTPEQRLKYFGKTTGRIKGFIWAKNLQTGRRTRMSKEDPRWLTGDYITGTPKT